jgi:hypothetical protein
LVRRAIIIILQDKWIHIQISWEMPFPFNMMQMGIKFIVRSYLLFCLNCSWIPQKARIITPPTANQIQVDLATPT